MLTLITCCDGNIFDIRGYTKSTLEATVLFNMNVADSKDQTMPVCCYLCWAIFYWMLKSSPSWTALWFKHELFCRTLCVWVLGPPLVVLFEEGCGSRRRWSLVGGSGPVKWALILSSLAPLPVHCLFPGGRHNVTSDTHHPLMPYRLYHDELKPLKL